MVCHVNPTSWVYIMFWRQKHVHMYFYFKFYIIILIYSAWNFILHRCGTSPTRNGIKFEQIILTNYKTDSNFSSKYQFDPRSGKLQYQMSHKWKTPRLKDIYRLTNQHYEFSYYDSEKYMGCSIWHLAIDNGAVSLTDDSFRHKQETPHHILVFVSPRILRYHTFLTTLAIMSTPQSNAFKFLPLSISNIC